MVLEDVIISAPAVLQAELLVPYFQSYTTGTARPGAAEQPAGRLAGAGTPIVPAGGAHAAGQA